MAAKCGPALTLALALASLVGLVAPVRALQQPEFPCQAAGFFADPNDCSKFVRCVDTYQSGSFQVYHFDCPDGE